MPNIRKETDRLRIVTVGGGYGLYPDACGSGGGPWTARAAGHVRAPSASRTEPNTKDIPGLVS